MEKIHKEIKRTDKQLFICPFCDKPFRALAYHTTQKHGITGKKLRKMFGLKAKYQLITPAIKQRHRELAINNNEADKLIRVGQKTRYQKGHEGHTKDRWSPQALFEMSKRRKEEIK